MVKDTQKTKTMHNQTAIKVLRAKYECSAELVRKAINGERTSKKALAIKTEYEQMNNLANALIETIAQKNN